MVRVGGRAARSIPGIRRLIRRVRPDLIYINTVTIPWWLTAARSMRIPVLCHVHEAEPDLGRAIGTAFTLPLLQANLVIANSRVAVEALERFAPRVRKRTVLVYNGVDGPAQEPTPPPNGTPARLVSVGRLSPRKGPDIALEALALLRAGGRDVTLELCGTPVPDQTWFADELLERASRPDLAGAVHFAGYCSPVWPALARADIYVAPARAEPLGNAVVEAQLARRPVVATAVQGHLETLIDGETGLHVPPDDPPALARAIARLLDDSALAATLADTARTRALELFSAQRYRADVLALMDRLGTNG
jgi:glycosyltransferase involved in cell wall biosynthesis